MIRRGFFRVALFSALLSPSCTQSGTILSLSADASASGGSSDGTGGASESTGGSHGLGGDGAFQPGPEGSSVQVDAGNRHTCAVIDGALYCWGENSSGALGLGDVDVRLVPTRVGIDEDWAKVEIGDGFSCGLRSGIVWCWGSGSSGQLGAAQFASSLVPLEVSLSGLARDVAVGHDHACAILLNDSLFCWGNNAEGQLAQNDPWTGPGVNTAVPVAVAPGSSFRLVALGQGHSCGIQLDGTLWCWGRNSSGELGQGLSSPDQTRTIGQTGSDDDWTALSSGQSHTCGVRANELYCWGDNESFQLGLPVVGFTDDPTFVPTPSVVESVDVDTFHSCALLSSGEVLCFGRNIEGQLGDGTITAREMPTFVVPAGDWDQISVGRFHSCAIRSGTVACTGENVDGRLGVGDAQRRREFTSTVFLP